MSAGRAPPWGCEWAGEHSGPCGEPSHQLTGCKKKSPVVLNHTATVVSTWGREGGGGSEPKRVSCSAAAPRPSLWHASLSLFLTQLSWPQFPHIPEFEAGSPSEEMRRWGPLQRPWRASKRCYLLLSVLLT